MTWPAPPASLFAGAPQQADSTPSEVIQNVFLRGKRPMTEPLSTREPAVPARSAAAAAVSLEALLAPLAAEQGAEAPASKRSRPSEPAGEAAAPAATGSFAHLLAQDADKWKCKVCSLKWEKSLKQCKACEAWHPDLSEAEIAAIEKEGKDKQAATIAMFTGGSASGAPPSTGFSVPAAPAPSGITFGFGASQPAAAPSGVTFGFAAAAPAAGPSGVTFGFGAPPGASAAAPAGPVTFGFGAGAVSAKASGDAGDLGGEKSEKKAPAEGAGQPLCDVFVHGSGECDQLGLGDGILERKTPSLIKALSGKRITDVAVGAQHVLCLSAAGEIFSWGCNDDYACGRPSGETTDCEPGLVPMPGGVKVNKVSCGDNHSCGLDFEGRVWLWGAYKDSNGHIMQAKHHTVWVEGCEKIASGANHTLALARGGRKVFAWGSNATGQLGLRSGRGCGFEEVSVPAAEVSKDELQSVSGAGSEYRGKAVARIRDASGAQRSAQNQKPGWVRQALEASGTTLVLEVPERDVPKPEKQELLTPQEVFLGDIDGPIQGIFASEECTFLTTASGAFGCGLNGDGQVGLGYASMAVRTPVRLHGSIGQADWIGGGLHFSTALVGGRVFAWGKAEECGLGLGHDAKIVLEPRAVGGLPAVRSLRCGSSHTLACSRGGDVYSWGCGLSEQLGNAPNEKEDGCGQEITPFLMTTEKFKTRYVLLADGGAQHSVELTWTGECAGGPGLSAAGADAALQESTTLPCKRGAEELADPFAQPQVKRVRTSWPDGAGASEELTRVIGEAPVWKSVLANRPACGAVTTLGAWLQEVGDAAGF